MDGLPKLHRHQRIHNHAVPASRIGNQFIDLINRADVGNADDHHGQIELNKCRFQNVLSRLTGPIGKHEDAIIIDRFHTSPWGRGNHNERSPGWVSATMTPAEKIRALMGYELPYAPIPKAETTVSLGQCLSHFRSRHIGWPQPCSAYLPAPRPASNSGRKIPLERTCRETPALYR